MKKKWIVYGFLAVIIALAFIACPDPKPEPDPDTGNWVDMSDPSSTAKLDYSVDSDGVCTITVSGTPEPNVPGNYKRYKASVGYRYTAKANTSYKYVFEAWTQSGDRRINAQYYYDSTDDEYALRDMGINSTRTTYTIIGVKLKGGERLLEFQCADQLGTFYVKVISITETTEDPNSPENWPDSNQRWNKWGDQSTTVLSYEVDSDGVCKITVTGTPVDDKWKSAATYQYIAGANTSYTYVFEAWTQSETRELGFQYYHNDDDEVYMGEDITIDSTQKTYTVHGGTIPKVGENQLVFQCANQEGTFYVKIISIKESIEESIEEYED